MTSREENAAIAVGGRLVANPYGWLENADDPKVQDWLEQQHKKRSDFVERGSAEWASVKGYVQNLPLYETDYFAVTYTADDCIFAAQPPDCGQVNIYTVPLAGGAPRLLVDPTDMFVEEGWRVQEGCLEASPCGSYLVFSVNHGGQDIADYRVLDLRTNQLLEDRIEGTVVTAVAWKPDSSGFFYGAFRSLLGDQSEPDGLYLHVLGAETDICLLTNTEAEQAEYLTLMPWVIPGTDTLLLKRYSYRTLSAGLWMLPIGASEPSEILFEDNETNFALVGIVNNTLYLNTVSGAGNGKIISVPLDSPQRENWLDIVPEGSKPVAAAFPGLQHNCCCIFGDKLFITYMVDAKHEVEQFSLDGAALGPVAIEGPVTIIGLLPVSEKMCLISLTSFLKPLSLYGLDQSLQLEPVVEHHLENSLTQGMEIQQRFYNADDGQKIPIYIIGKDLDKEGLVRPTLLYGYGGFGQAITPVFNPDLPAWLKMGGTYALANIRGGGEYGKAWHEAAKAGKRGVAFDDFRAAADYLCDAGLTDGAHLAIRGISNGGLLVGASVLRHPKKWAAAIAEVPLLDLVQMLGQPGADVLCEEYGDINGDADVRDYVLGYSPVQNVQPGIDYPAVMLVPAEEDPRAPASHAWKFAAELQSKNPHGKPVIVCTVPDEGHVNWATENIANTIADEMMFLRRTIAGLEVFRNDV